MNGFEERSGNIEVPKNAGIEGFVHTIRSILQQHTYVQRIEIDSKGFITFRYFAQKEMDRPQFKVDFEFLQPDAIIRNGEVKELLLSEDLGASTMIGILFEAAARERLYPVAFASGSASQFWEWHHQTTGVPLQSRESVYGLPFLTDRHIPDSVLLLCTALGRGAAFVDIQVSYKITMDAQRLLPPATVDIIP